MEKEKYKKYGKIAPALVAAQSEFPSIPKNAQGYGYKYATLDDILTIVKPVLHKNGLVITQLLEQDGIRTMLLHDSGEYIESWAELPPLSQNKNMNAAQAAGAAITYMRRYGISALLNLSVDEDTDGTTRNRTSEITTNQYPKPNSTSGSMGFNKAPAPQVEEKGKTPEEDKKENPPAVQAKPEPQEGNVISDKTDEVFDWNDDTRRTKGLCSRGQQNFIFSLATRAFGLDFSLDEISDWTSVDKVAFVDTSAESFCGRLTKMDATRVVGSLKELVGME